MLGERLACIIRAASLLGIVADLGKGLLRLDAPLDGGQDVLLLLGRQRGNPGRGGDRHLPGGHGLDQIRHSLLLDLVG